MKILFSIESLGPGGKERRLTDLIKFLLENTDHKIGLVVFREIFHYSQFENKKVEIYKLNKGYIVAPFILFHKICREFKPDVIHTWGNFNSMYAIPVSILKKIPIINNQVTTIARMRWPEKFFFFQIPFLFSKVVIGNSLAGLKSFGVNKQKARCIYNGFDFNRIGNLLDKNKIIDELGIKSKQVVGMVASSSKAKDYKTYIMAAIHVLNKGYDVTFIGIGAGVRKAYEEEIPEKYNNRIKFFDAKPNIESFMNVCDIGVLSSNYEGLPNVVLEFMALGKPVISTPVGGVPELITDNEDGFLFPVGNTDLLVEKIVQLLKSSNLRNKIGQSAKVKIKQKFSYEKMMDSYLNVFKDFNVKYNEHRD